MKSSKHDGGQAVSGLGMFVYQKCGGSVVPFFT